MTNLNPDLVVARPRVFWRDLVPRRSPKLLVGGGLILAITGWALLGPLVVGDPEAISDIGLTGPSAAYPLGTTQTGQDVLAQLAYATRGSLYIGVLVGVLATVLSALFGIVGSYLGGLVDEAFSLLSNVMLVIPGLPLVIVISAFVPASARGAWTIAVVLAVTGWAGSARVLRAQTLSLRNRDYVLASRLGGERPWRVVAVEILPNLLPLLASQLVFAMIAAILSEAGLSFLGLGASNSATLGTMLNYAQNGFALQRGAWWWFVPPGLVIALFGCGLALVNFSLDEIINPRLRNIPRRRQPVDRPVAPLPVPRPDADTVLSVRDLSVTYQVERPVRAVRDVSFTLGRGEILGLAGESGCGKTTLAYAVSRLLRPPAEITAGAVTLHDRSGRDTDVLALAEGQLRASRWAELSMVFQGAMNALNPVMTIRAQLADVLTTHRPRLSRRERYARCREALTLVGVDLRWLRAYPHELSGGMRQRVMIAMALLLEPQIVVLDEPTTALDVVVQREILREVRRLRDELRFAVLFITHDLPLLLEVSDRIAIMRDGRIVEHATAEQISTRPSHPYTRHLLDSFPSLTGERGELIRPGEPAARSEGEPTSPGGAR
ncbi:dipeptide/oligopeptide/nickel ABC transporter permease/ATP-binding protein [Plantactinospora soyae]|uniref:ABC-type dipeptide/oligopeptide/nickel transport system ATPase component/ABC-type dipeptide/oligopeptide/nickel transport system permease subunit n=1 Tax=Plantactinospora soyae TaxID=1544732 RepID=A0A927MAK6_9ACTN|nr:dipeptide/oligopeptide/nickel ABC transporter permease/ATP-binding protein [Plantactinospora soyae]MBE1491032.1 ABC-type dipeptide/oligopeptide/nickel transport system ATPase component/ABC-type dipeptide/oligopeptide/nickel transport system permease subunit [Plantactinospora soyae]